MTPKQFRSSAAWQKARARALRGATTCSGCGRVLRTDLGPRHSSAPSVDHRIPLASIDLDTLEGRALAVDPEHLTVMCIGCNSKRGARYGARKRSVPQVWDLNDYREASRAW